jgi:hypothetical protein
MRETLKAWRAAHPGWGPTTLYGELEIDERFNGQELPSVRSIAGFLKQEELTRSYERHNALPHLLNHHAHSLGPGWREKPHLEEGGEGNLYGEG